MSVATFHVLFLFDPIFYNFFQELLFCETCDTVFCTLCTGGTHKPGPGSGLIGSGSDTSPNSPSHHNNNNNSCSTVDHTVIPFSIAIKRMSEILIYKANECTAKVSLSQLRVFGGSEIESKYMERRKLR